MRPPSPLETVHNTSLEARDPGEASRIYLLWNMQQLLDHVLHLCFKEKTKTRHARK